MKLHLLLTAAVLAGTTFSVFAQDKDKKRKKLDLLWDYKGLI